MDRRQGRWHLSHARLITLVGSVIITATHDIRIDTVAPRTIAATHRRVRKGDVASAFGEALDAVYSAARDGAGTLDGQNVFVYRPAVDMPGHLDVAFGVGVRGAFMPREDVGLVVVPGGRVVTTTHIGDYSGLRAAHDALQAWSRAHDVRFEGTSWEVYGHWPIDNAPPRTDLFYLIAE